MSRNQLQILLIILLFIATQLISATEITVVDQSEKPVANAILEIKTSSKGNLDTSKTYIVDQVDKSFVPYVRIVPEGAFVDFPNSDNIRHHVYSFSEAKFFELKLYADRPEKPVQFPDPGVVVLGCNIHDSMVGYIYVTTTQHTFKSDANGRIAIPEIPSDFVSASIWHPDASEGIDYRLAIEATALSSGSPIFTIAIKDPAPRNTFEDVFKKQ